MPISTRYLFTASMDVAPDKEALFDEVYDQEHVPNLLKVPGVISVTRLTLEPLSLSIGGEPFQDLCIKPGKVIAHHCLAGCDGDLGAAGHGQDSAAQCTVLLFIRMAPANDADGERCCERHMPRQNTKAAARIHGAQAFDLFVDYGR